MLKLLIMKISLKYSIFFIVFVILSCENTDTEEKDYYKLADADVPGTEAKIFAKDFVSKDSRFVQYCSFSPDGKEFYFSNTDSAWGKSFILKLDLENPSNLETINLTNSDYQSGQFIDRSGKKLFFTAVIFSDGMWHSDVFMSEKKEKKWDKSVKLPAGVNSYICEWHPTLTNKGEMYFASERNYDHGSSDIYKADDDKKNQYTKVEKLPGSVNTDFNETDPLIAPDGSFLIFASNRPNGVSGPDVYNRQNGFDETDLYICFNKGNNTWTEAKNMGTAVNSDSWEFAPALSPDQKYLFFTRRETFKTLNPSKIYWVDAKIIDSLKE